MRVLLVLPNADLRGLYAEELSAAGYAPEGTSDWDEALGAVRASRPAVIVVDASSDLAAAARFVRNVRAEGSQLATPIVGIAWSAGSETGVLQAGAQCCLRWLPWPSDLVKAVRWADEVYNETEPADVVG